MLKMAGGSRNNVEFLERPTPKFLQKFRAQAGLESQPTIDSKISKSGDASDEDDILKEDEKPSICLAENVSEAEAADFMKREFEVKEPPGTSRKRGSEESCKFC